MAKITAYCAEAQGLRLGPGLGNTPIPGELIVFQEGYATFEESDYPNWEEWRRGAPFIEILDSGAGEVPAIGDAEFVCDIEDGKHDGPKAFATKAALNGHKMSHRKK